ncbi:hypothetical protein HAX54_039181, partial [Datura stramonium]|nr:hypothetical protein [Datura stramonium]
MVKKTLGVYCYLLRTKRQIFETWVKKHLPKKNWPSINQQHINTTSYFNTSPEGINQHSKQNKPDAHSFNFVKNINTMSTRPEK